jgi:hypothetical protein
MGLYEGTVQHIITGFYMLPNADDKRKFNVSRKKMRTKKRREERTGDKKISIKKTQVHLILDLGACVIRRREQLKKQIKLTNVARRNIWNRSIYFS